MSTRPPVFHEAPAVPSFLDPYLLERRYLVDTGAWRIHVQEQGRGVPIVLLHGNPTWGILWRHVVRRLPAGCRAICPDLVGLGLSDKPRHLDVHTLAMHGTTVERLLETLDLAPFVLVVQDWGGPIGLSAIRNRLPQLRGLVVLNTVLSPPREGSRGAAFHRFARMPVLSELAFQGLGFPLPILHTAQGDPGSLRGEVMRAYRWPLRALRDRVAPLALARMVPSHADHPTVPAMKQVAETARAWVGPTEIVWGSRDPVLGRALKRVQETLPHARVTLTEGGHFLQEEVPDRIAEAIVRVVDASSTESAHAE